MNRDYFFLQKNGCLVGTSEESTCPIGGTRKVTQPEFGIRGLLRSQDFSRVAGVNSRLKFEAKG